MNSLREMIAVPVIAEVESVVAAVVAVVVVLGQIALLVGAVDGLESVEDAQLETMMWTSPRLRSCLPCCHRLRSC